MNLLLSASDFISYRELSLNIDAQNRLEPYIRQAQQLDLKPLLGDVFFEDLIQNMQSTVYQTLLNGGAYGYNNQNVSFTGLKAALIFFTYSRFIENQNINVTRFGVVYKNNAEVSERIDERVLQRIITQSIEQGKAYWLETITFLNRNNSIYPLWKGCNSESKGKGVIISSVG